MQISGYLLLILISLQWNFYDSIQFNKGMTKKFAVERKLKDFFEKKETLRKTRWSDFESFRTALKSWIKSLRRFNVCRLSPQQKQELCNSILLTDRYGYALLDYMSTPECGRHKVAFKEKDTPSMKKDRGKLVLKMFPCKVEFNSKIQYYISGTTEEEPSLYFFIQKIEDETNPGPIYVDAYVTDLPMTKLEEVQEIAKNPRRNTYLRNEKVFPE